MDILQQLQNVLLDEKILISCVSRKAEVLARQINSDELDIWVSQELNGYAERFMRTIKEDEVDLSEYRDFSDSQDQIGFFHRSRVQ